MTTQEAFTPTVDVESGPRAKLAKVLIGSMIAGAALRVAAMKSDDACVDTPVPDADDALVEIMARAICRSRGWSPDLCVSGGGSMSHDGKGGMYCHVRQWQTCIPDARAALNALREHGKEMG